MNGVIIMSKSIVVLDGHTLTPNTPQTIENSDEPQWRALNELAPVTVYPRTHADDTLQRIGEAEMIFTNKVHITAEHIAQLPKLKYIGVLATGYNVVDLKAASDAGIVVTNVPAYSTHSVAQHVFALTMELLIHTASHGLAVHQGAWSASQDFMFTVQPTVELAGKTLAIVGVGAIGKQVARIGHALGMNIAALKRPSSASTKLHGIDINWLSFDELLAQADVLTLHCPLTDENEHLINAQALGKMKRTAILINTGRGLLIDEPALADALKTGSVAGAGLDVLSSEPPSKDNPLIGAPRCVITPHIAWATRDARMRLMNIATENVKHFLANTPQNQVN